MRKKSLQTALLITLISGIAISCGYKKGIGDKVYVQRKAVGSGMAFVVHSNPNCHMILILCVKYFHALRFPVNP